MKTPKNYQDNIKQCIITSSMLEDALYSVNKRAKNYRDAAKKTRSYTNRFCAYDNNDVKKEEMYKHKETLLKCINPICIHKEKIGYEKTRVYDYQPEYEQLYWQNMIKGRIVWQNCYYRRNNDYYDDYYCPYNAEPVYFFDYVDPNQPKYQYYLYYELGTHSFHSLIDAPNQFDLPIIEIGRLETKGDEINDLLSMQFIRKMLDLIEKGNYQYIVDSETISQDYDNSIKQTEFRIASWERVWNYLRNCILERVREEESATNGNNFTLDEINSVNARLKTKNQKIKKDGKKIRVHYQIAEFSSHVKENKITAPELAESDISFLASNYSATQTSDDFIELLFKTSLNERFFAKELYPKYKLNRLAKELNACANKMYCQQPRDISIDEVIELFIRENNK